jgi:hypothetical protein
MSMLFDEAGIRFRYPENWKMEREENDQGWTVSVQSPATAFMLISVRQDLPTTEELVEAALSALKEDYPNLEAEGCAETFAGQPAVGCEIQFFSLDLTNTCWTRSFYSAQGTVLVLCQTCDIEDNEVVLRAMCASMEVDDE